MLIIIRGNAFEFNMVNLYLDNAFKFNTINPRWGQGSFVFPPFLSSEILRPTDNTRINPEQ